MIWRVFKYLKYFKVELFLNIFFNLLSVVFNLFSFVLIIPFVELLFGLSVPPAEAPAFAARKINRLLRHIASIVLLATYLPMVALSSLHVHHETVDVHDDCQQCAGHIEEVHHHDHDCLYCTFLSLNYLIQDNRQIVPIIPTAEYISTPTLVVVPQFRHGVSQLRAPPMA